MAPSLPGVILYVEECHEVLTGVQETRRIFALTAKHVFIAPIAEEMGTLATLGSFVPFPRSEGKSRAPGFQWHRSEIKVRDQVPGEDPRWLRISKADREVLLEFGTATFAQLIHGILTGRTPPFETTYLTQAEVAPLLEVGNNWGTLFLRACRAKNLLPMDNTQHTHTTHTTYTGLSRGLMCNTPL